MKNNIILTGILCPLCLLIALIGYTHPTINTSIVNPTNIVVNPGQSIQAAIISASTGTNINC